jgi:hypothetical protein
MFSSLHLQIKKTQRSEEGTQLFSSFVRTLLNFKIDCIFIYLFIYLFTSFMIKQFFTCLPFSIQTPPSYRLQSSQLAHTTHAPNPSG